MLVRSKFFSQFVEKIEKLTLGLSKQLNKMLKIRLEMLKIRTNGKIVKLGKNSREFSVSRKSREFSGSREICKKLPVSRERENLGERETLVVKNLKIMN